MRKIVVGIFAALLIFTACSSCKKIAQAFGGSDVVVPQYQITVPIVPFVLPTEISLGSYSFSFNLDSVVRANTSGLFGAKDVNSIKIKHVTINILNADQLNNLANFSTARVTLYSNTNSNPVELFAINFPDVYASSYTYTTTSSPELLSYLKGSLLTYTLYGKMRRITTKPLSMTLDVTMRAN